MYCYCMDIANMHNASRCYYSTMIISNSDTVTVNPLSGSALLKTREVSIATVSCQFAPHVTIISENI